MPFIIHLLLGTFISFFAAMPLGPVNLAIVQTAINHGRWQAVLVAVGSSLVELIYCLISVWGIDLLFSNQQDQDITLLFMQLVSIPLMFTLGIHNLVKRVKEDEDGEKVKRFSRMGGMAMGFMLNLFNPMLLPFWIMVAGYLRSRSWISDDLSHLVTYSVGVMLGTLLLQTLVALFASRKQEGMSHRSKVRVTRVIGWLFISLGMYLIVQMCMTAIEKGWI
ncbi:MAG: LysE family transporter [Bacteroidetes bacterium]|nr:LysE family transporter [Bacteroidota bacterium]